MGATPLWTSEMITLLERKGLIARSESPATKRILRIGVTPAGAARLKVCDSRVDRFEGALLARLGDARASALHQTLAAILQTDRAE